MTTTIDLNIKNEAEKLEELLKKNSLDFSVVPFAPKDGNKKLIPCFLSIQVKEHNPNIVQMIVSRFLKRTPIQSPITCNLYYFNGYAVGINDRPFMSNAYEERNNEYWK